MVVLTYERIADRNKGILPGTIIERQPARRCPDREAYLG